MIIDIYIIAGWLGMFLMILAYFLLSSKKLASNSLRYNMLNLFGGIGVLISAINTKLWPVVVLNIFWVGISIISIIKKKKSKK